MRIGTWNVNSLRVRQGRVLSFLERTGLEVLCIQETKLADAAFDPAPFEDLGYSAVHHGDGRWNGVAILSRVGLEAVQVGLGTSADAAGCRLVAASCAGVRVVSVYVPNGRSLEDPHFDEKLRWLDDLVVFAAASAEDFGSVAIAGDYNIAPADRDVWDPAGLVGMTHVSEPERARLAALEAAGYGDAFRRVEPEQAVYSWWDYRGGAFHRNHGMRIDLCYASADLLPRVRGAEVVREERKGEQPSDHVPVIIDFEG